METLRYIRKIRNTRLLFSNVPVFDQKAFIQFQPVSNGPTNGSINGYPSKEAALNNITNLKKAKPSVVQKPPPIFVYTADDANKFNRFSSFLQQILLPDTNTIAQISLISLFKQPWIDEKPACLIILNVIPFDEFVSYLLHSYLEKNGKVIFAYQNDPNSQESLSLWKEAFRKSLYKENVIFLDYNIENLLEENGILKTALADLGIELAKEHRSIEFSKGYLIAAQDRILWNMQGLRYGDYIGEKPILFLQPSIVLANNPHVLPKADENLLPIEVCRRNKAVIPNGNFGIEEYFGILKTQSLGKVLLYVPVCESTMEVAKSLTTMANDMSGIVVVAGHQTKSRGRSGNQWLSVPGSALFTFNFQLSMNSNLGKFLGYIQHIVAAAIVDTINTLADQETGVKIKWPNDIYFNRESKIGGILVQSSCKNDVFQCLIGMGLNVDNAKPTICINDILPDYCEKLTIEAVIAEFMNKFEEYVQLFEERGRFEFLHKYYQHWLHSQEEVTVDMDGDPEQVIIQGLNEHGYLEVRSKKNGIISHVTDNGNSFDMMEGLIRAKFI